MDNKYFGYFISLIVFAIAGCSAEGGDPGYEYAPQMYHSVPYEPLTQITDKDAGEWLTSTDEEDHAEFYNSNPYNPYNMNERVPPAHTVRRTGNEVLPYRIHKDSLDYAARVLKNPLDSSAAMVEAGKELYAYYCQHCHGGAGQGDGLVGVVYKGVPAYNAGRVAELSGGHIFHVITHGKGRMGPHGSQIDIEDRWKIVEYVQTLQKP